MPGSPRSLRVTDLYRSRLLGIVNRVETRTRQLWPAIEDFDQASEPWLAATAATVTGAQREAVRATSGYLAAFLSSELGRRAQPPPLDSRSYAGIARDGRSVTEALQSPLIAVKVALKEGQEPLTALQAGLDRALRAVELDTKHSARQSLQDAMVADDRIIGWRRAVRGTCGACAGEADGSVMPPGTPLQIHPNCACVSEMVVRGVSDRFSRPTGSEIFAAMPKAEQDEQFGPEIAEAVRTGALSLSALVDRSPQATQEDFITAKPAAALAIATKKTQEVEHA